MGNFGNKDVFVKIKMGLVEDYYEKGIDYSKLPLDCPAVAAERMRRQYIETRSIDPRDMEIVLWDPIKGVKVPISGEDVGKHLEECLKDKGIIERYN